MYIGLKNLGTSKAVHLIVSYNIVSIQYNAIQYVVLELGLELGLRLGLGLR